MSSSGAVATDMGVLRTRLLRSMEGRCERLVVVAAGPGFGKTVVAAQYSQSGPFDETMWRSCGTGLCDSESATRLQPGSAGTEVTPSSSDAGVELADWLDRVAGSFEGSAICIVLDDIPSSALRMLPQLTDRLVQITSQRSCLLATTRSLPAECLGELQGAWILEARDLRFSREEALSLAHLLLGDGQPVELVEDCLSLSGGHPALLSLILRHAGIEDPVDWAAVDTPASIAQCLLSTAHSGLDKQGRRCFVACGLLRSGSGSDLNEVLERDGRAELVRVARAMQALSLDCPSSPTKFSMHTLVSRVVSAPEFLQQVEGVEGVRDAVLSRLRSERRYRDYLEIVLLGGCREELAVALDGLGQALLEQGHVGVLSRAVQRLPVAMQLRTGRTMLLAARVALLEGNPEEALRRSAAAREIAGHDEDSRTVAEASVLQARVCLSMGLPGEAKDLLREALSDVDQSDPELSALLQGHLVICSSLLGEVREARHWNARLEELRDSAQLPATSNAFAVHASSIVTGLLEGRWCDIVEPLNAVADDSSLSLEIRMMSLNNSAHGLAQMGRLSQATRAAEGVVEACEAEGMTDLAANARGGIAIVHAAQGRYGLAEKEIAESYRGMETTIHPAEDPAFLARWRRAAGDLDGALEAVESGHAARSLAPSSTMFRALLEVEHAACMVSLGDLHRAKREAEAVRQKVAAVEASYHLLLADVVLSEIARREGRRQEALARMLEHAEYIATESANLVLALYIRCFPGLLGIIAGALGVDCLPSHLLRLLDGREARDGLQEAWGSMPRTEWDALAGRLLSEDELLELVAKLEYRAPCMVQLFGGLQVTTPERTIPDRSWRKRKARQLFAMLVARRGCDVARDQILDHLWPEMDEAKARNNFYVVWNTLKGALSPNLPKGEACPYVESVGGICRINSDLVWSDLADFEECVSAARECEAQSDTDGALQMYRRIDALYSGDLLPGDQYDDWFGTLRSRCRQQFGDAMVRAAQCATERGHHDDSLHALWRALEADPLREDAYQAVLRIQICAGQRSAAIDTFMTCRKHLADELGLDPSVETQALYQDVLAMEGGLEADGSW